MKERKEGEYEFETTKIKGREKKRVRKRNYKVIMNKEKRNQRERNQKEEYVLEVKNKD